MKLDFGRSSLWGFVIILLVGLGFRLALLEYPGLSDPTEGRYAFVSQEMLLSGDWITPKVPEGTGAQPYLGKPPLFFWMMASSFRLFGMDEWVARLPCFLALVLLLGLVWNVAQEDGPRERGGIAALITLFSGFGFFGSGTATIDLVFAATLFVGVWSYLRLLRHGISSIQLVMGGLSVGAALLLRGPVALVLLGVPILFTEFRTKGIGLRFIGYVLLLGLLVAFPWFLVAEFHNPGFLKYFLWNEHILRYLSANYGDRYGSGHQYPHGSSVWMFSVGFLPWTPWLMFLLGRRMWKRQLFPQSDGAVTLCEAFLLWNVLFFAFARQLHLGYLVPTLPVSAVILARAWTTDQVRFPTHLGRMLGILSIGVAVGILGYSRCWTFERTLFFLAILAVTFSLVGGSIVWKQYSTALARIVGLCFCFYSIVGASVIAMASRLEPEHTTLPLLKCVVQNGGGLPSSISVAGDSNFSALFYSRAWEEELERPVSLAPFHPESNSETQDILLKRSELWRLPESMRDEYDLLNAGGRWHWFHRKGVPLDTSHCSLAPLRLDGSRR